MKSISLISSVLLGIWMVAHFIFCGYAALFLGALMGLQFTEIHTSGTAMDPILDLTTEIVRENIIATTLSWIFVVPVAGAISYFLNHAFLESLGLGK